MGELIVFVTIFLLPMLWLARIVYGFAQPDPEDCRCDWCAMAGVNGWKR